MSTSWDTKWGSRRVRHDPPTLGEALTAAKGFTDDVDEQAAIAAGLMGVGVAAAMTELRRLPPEPRGPATSFGAREAKRTLVVERKVNRRIRPPAGPANPRPPLGARR